MTSPPPSNPYEEEESDEETSTLKHHRYLNLSAPQPSPYASSDSTPLFSQRSTSKTSLNDEIIENGYASKPLNMGDTSPEPTKPQNISSNIPFPFSKSPVRSNMFLNRHSVAALDELLERNNSLNTNNLKTSGDRSSSENTDFNYTTSPFQRTGRDLLKRSGGGIPGNVFFSNHMNLMSNNNNNNNSNFNNNNNDSSLRTSKDHNLDRLHKHAVFRQNSALSVSLHHDFELERPSEYTKGSHYNDGTHTPNYYKIAYYAQNDDTDYIVSNQNSGDENTTSLTTSGGVTRGSLSRSGNQKTTSAKPSK